MSQGMVSHRCAQDSLTVLRGIGPKRAQAFQEVLGVHTVEQLLRLLPRGYEEFPKEVALKDLGSHAGALVRVRGAVVSSSVLGWGRKAVLQVRLEQQKTHIHALFFNQAYRRKQFPVGLNLLLEGKVSTKRGLQLLAPVVVMPGELPQEGLRALYPQPEAMPRGAIRRAVQSALPWLEGIPEPLPDSVLALAAVLPLPLALSALHAPSDFEQVRRARRRLALDEILTLELRRRRSLPTHIQPPPSAPFLWPRILGRIPFPLNAEQQQVLARLRCDLGATTPMRRLLHGEVGSGKTAVAFAIALAVAADGGQVALMAPTELLARQHLRTFRSWLQGSRLTVVGLLGDDPAALRKSTRLALRNGQASIAIGTHALLQKDVVFRNLRLVVFDEQHRFGVRQKAALCAKAEAPHVLTMTATPIPRTLAWAHYGALDPCVLRQRAGAGAAIRTQILATEQWEAEALAVQQELRSSQRSFLVVPRIDGEQGLLAWVARFFTGPWKGIPYAVVHGRMPGAAVEAAVEAFRQGAVQVLCGTTVVEVGIDVAGVEHLFLCGAERLGLASIHQLRGRLARGVDSPPGNCRIFASNPASLERLKSLEACADGFQVAALDLQERGSGTLVGTRQHGASDFSAFDPLVDEDLIQLLHHQELRNWMAAQG